MLRPMRALLAVRERRRRTRERLQAALEHMSSNREELSRSDMAGCVFCLHLFNPQDEELQYGGRDYEGAYIGPDDALCPGCGFCGGLIGSASGYPITLEFMAELNEDLSRGTFFERVSLVVGIAVLLAAIVLAFIYLPFLRVFFGLVGLALVALGVHATIKRKIEDSEWVDVVYTGRVAVFMGIVYTFGGLALLASAVFAPWE